MDTMDDKKRKIIEALSNLCIKEEDISMAFLFGSFAKNRETSQSDMDIAVFLEKEWAIEKINEFWGEIDATVKRETDLIILNDARPTIAWTAIRGISLKIKDYKFYLEYMLKVSREAEDSYDYVTDFFNLRERIRQNVPVE